jgi:hypothetical protein
MAENVPPKDGSQLTLRPVVASYFGTLAAEGNRGPIGELTVILSSGVLEPGAFRAHAKHHGVRGEKWFTLQVIDLSLGFIEQALKDGPLTSSELADIRALNAFLQITDGQFLQHRPGEVAAILCAQLERILEDEEISDEEELFQVDLQAAFGLGYDDYLALTRRAFERAHLDLTAQAAGSGINALVAKRKLASLEPVFRLATARRRTPGAMY